MGFVKTTALILTYNQEDCIQDAIESVVNQTLQPDEILITDDCSTDSTFYRAQQLVEEVRQSGRFKGAIRLNRNEKNLGFIPHFNWAVEACSGDLILYNAGDDTSMPNRLETFIGAYHDRGDPKYFLGHSSVQIKGGPQDGGIWVPPVEQAQFPLERLANSVALHIGAAQCFTKALFTDFGPIRFEDAYEDLILGFRALLTDAYWYSPNSLLTYRIGGLTFWQKNTWEKKRRRYEAVLSQRSLDALKHGSPDLVGEIALVYEDYGFGLSTHPNCTIVYSEVYTRRSLFDYSIEDHFHRLPQVLLPKSLDIFINEHVEARKPFDKERVLVFLRLSLLGLPAVLNMLERLQNIKVKLILDLGINPQVVHNLEQNTDLLDRLKFCMTEHSGYRITTACQRIGLWLARQFGQVFVPSPLLVDVDGPSLPGHFPIAPQPIKILVVCDTCGESLVDLEASLAAVKARHPQQHLEVYIPEEVVNVLGSKLSYLHQDCHITPFILKDCGRDQFENFAYTLLLKTEGEIEDLNSGFLKHLEMLALARCVHLIISSNEGLSLYVTQADFDAERSNLYFEASIQKRVAEFLDVLLSSMLNRSGLFRRLAPL
jgi:glycosyltransferase involved in cell wall biosynthesis